MEKVILKYDPSTGNIFDGNGAFLFSWMNLVPVEESPEHKEDLSKLTKLKAMGFDVTDMERINELGLL